MKSQETMQVPTLAAFIVCGPLQFVLLIYEFFWTVGLLRSNTLRF